MSVNQLSSISGWKVGEVIYVFPQQNRQLNKLVQGIKV
jgi:hypothetical protein